jgi:hypothetical protein
MFYALAILHLIGSGYTYYRLYMLQRRQNAVQRLLQGIDASLVEVVMFCNSQDKQILDKVVELSRDQVVLMSDVRWLQLMLSVDPDKIPNV